MGLMVDEPSTRVESALDLQVAGKSNPEDRVPRQQQTGERETGELEEIQVK
jgi:hypothetical protein